MKLFPPLVLPSFAMLAMTQTSVSAAEKPTPDTLWYTSPASKVIVLAHRGCWGQVPEVSIAAIKACGPIGVDAAELDVRMTRDGVLVLMHDETVDRMTNGTGAIANMSAAEVRALRLKAGTGGPNAALTDEHVPTLEQALEVARGKIAVNLHLKVPIEAKVAETLKHMKMSSQVTTWVPGNPGDDSLAQSPLLGAIGLIPTINECSSHHPPPCWSAQVLSLTQFARYRPVGFFLDWMTSRAFIRQVASIDRPAGSRIFVETLNAVDQLPQVERRAEWRKLIDMGVSVIMTDHPADLIDFLRANEVTSASTDEAKRPRAY
jgi:glycerophosphoryl diester phosphodiesterase